ncbi:MAG: ABC transporter permease [Chloroflexi bacterium]|nr:ABC transporter permease [Chloroflexota bacterium]
MSATPSMPAKTSGARHGEPAASARERLIFKRSSPWRRFLRNPLAMIGAIVLLLLILSAVLADVLVPFDPYKAVFQETLQQPSAKHLLGTDHIGRDVLSRMLYAGRYSLLIGFAVQTITLLIGLPLGGWAGAKGGRTDFVIMRLLDVMGSFPTLLFQLVLVSVLSNYVPAGVWTVVLALSLTGWMGITWLVRAQVLSLREREFIAASRALGGSEWHIVRQHLIPNALGPIIVGISFGVPGIIGAEAGLSFLGLGISPPTPTWGQMLGDAGKYIQSMSGWYMIIPPAVVMAVVLLSFQFVGDGLQDVFNPRNSSR